MGHIQNINIYVTKHSSGNKNINDYILNVLRFVDNFVQDCGMLVAHATSVTFPIEKIWMTLFLMCTVLLVIFSKLVAC